MSTNSAPEELQQVMDSLRKIVKLRGMTYADLSKKIKVSEVTIKRLFNANDVSMVRIMEICAVLGISFADLILQSQEQTEKIFSLSRSQEQFFAEHPSDFAFFMELLEAPSSFTSLQKRLKLSTTVMRAYLMQLERLKLIERREGDRFQMRVEGTLNWLPKGPLQKKYLGADNQAFVFYISEHFERDQHFLTTADRLIHPDTYNALLADLKALVSHYRKRAYRDQQYFPREELLQVKWLIGSAPYVRSWKEYLSND